jgi:hypothetical protein
VQGTHRSAIQNLGNRLADEHLNRLDEEFQFSNPPRAQLHIPMLMSAPRDLFIDHLFDGTDIAHNCQRPLPRQGLEIRLQNKSFDHPHERLSDRRRTGDRPGLEQRQPLPHLATVGIVLFVSFDRSCELADRTLCAQPQINAKHRTFTSLFGQGLRQ